MLRSRILMAALCALALPTGAFAQPANTLPDILPDILPFRATEKTLPNGLKVIVVPTGFPNIVVGADPGADRLAQRGRARQVRLRPLLRAHDVPRHARSTRPTCYRRS